MMTHKNAYIFSFLDPDVRKHPEMLLTSGFRLWDAFIGTSLHESMVCWYVQCVMKFQHCKWPNSRVMTFPKFGVTKWGHIPGHFLYQFTMRGISELILPAKWATDNVTLTNQHWNWLVCSSMNSNLPNWYNSVLSWANFEALSLLLYQRLSPKQCFIFCVNRQFILC